MNPTDWVRSYEAHEPRQCFWCRFGGVVLGIDPFEMLACLNAAVSRPKREKKSTLPVGWDERPTLKCVSPDECCERWEPTRVGSHRMKAMEACGMFDEAERTERKAAKRKEAKR